MSTVLATLPRALAAHAALQPDAVAFAAPGTTTVTWRDVERETAERAAALTSHGVAAGSRVALSCAPSVEVVLAYLALLRLGAVVVPANTGYTEREVAHIIADAQPMLAIADSERQGIWTGAGVPSVLAPSDLVGAETSIPALDGQPLDEATIDQPAMIGYTSGTTGAPKGALLSHGNLAAGAASVVAAWEWTSADRLLLSLPLFHMHGLGVGVNGTVVSGGSAVVLPRFDTDAVVDAIRQDAVTMFFGVPTMYARLAASESVGELAALRLAVSGSAPLPPAIWQRLHAVGVDVLERYGMTETVMLAANPLRGERRPGSVGFALPDVELRLGADGVVEARGPNVFAGYLDRPDATSEAFTDDGWFRTGDVGVFDADGYLSLIGRASELIISGGFNVYPREVEDVLRGSPAVADVAVVGTPDDEWGEVVTAFVVLSTESDEDSLALLEPFAREHLAAFKVPRRWHTVDELPRNAMGKVVRAALVAATDR